jgi:uncharacterized protein (TIGR02996 family)
MDRILEKSGKQLTLTAEDRAAAERLVEQSKAKLKQGWAPVASPTRAVQLGKHLEKLGLDPSEFVAAFSDAELDAFYAQLIRDGRDVSLYVLRARPRRALLEHLMTIESNLFGSDFSKAIKFICKNEEVAPWVASAMEAALANKPSPQLKKFATQQLKNLGTRAVTPEAPKVEAGDETSLLRQIAAQPADDAPRLVYADFLTEKGFGWGEVMTLSLKQPEYGTPEYEQLEKLTKKHLKAWLEPIRPFITGWSVSRGLLDFVDTQPGKFIEAAEAISLRAPRGVLMLGGLKAKDLPALAATPLGRFREVRLSQQRLDDAQLAVLVASPTIAGVEEWDLVGNHFGDEGVKALARSPHLANCKVLLLGTLDQPTLTSEGLAALLVSTHLTSLERLVVDVTEIGGAFSTCRAKLTSLELKTAGALDDAALLAVAKTPSLAGLTHLNVGWNSRVHAARHAGGSPFSAPALEQVAALLPKLKSLSIPAGELPQTVKATLSARLST